jgi:two-component system phosphate regulon sensor histidine kinase PhoR
MLLEEELGDLNDKQKQGLQMVAGKTEELGQLIEDIFAIQSIETTSLNLRDFDLSILLEVSLESFIDWGHKSDVNLQSDFPPDLPLLRADPSLVERAIEHLLDNAIKFSPDGGPVILKARPEGKMMRIEVQDHGIGIPAESLPYIFDRFYQVDGSTTRRFRGTGLGLAIVRQIAEAHGGQVGVSSIKGEGSTFFFTVPLAPISKAMP